MSPTTLQEEVWSLKMELEDAKETIQIKSTQAAAQAEELRRLRWEIRIKDLQLNETRRVLAGRLEGLKVDIDSFKIRARPVVAKPSEQASMLDHHGTASQSSSRSITSINPQPFSSQTMTDTQPDPQATTTLSSSVPALVPQVVPAEPIIAIQQGTAPAANEVEGPFPPNGAVRELDSGSWQSAAQPEVVLTTSTEFYESQAKRRKRSAASTLSTELNPSVCSRCSHSVARPSKVVVLKYNKDMPMTRRCARMSKEDHWALW